VTSRQVIVSPGIRFQDHSPGPSLGRHAAAQRGHGRSAAVNTGGGVSPVQTAFFGRFRWSSTWSTTAPI